MVIFLQPVRWAKGPKGSDVPIDSPYALNYAYLSTDLKAFEPEIDRKRVATMNKKQRNLLDQRRD